MLRDIKDSDIVMHARLRMNGSEAFSDCIVVKVHSDSVSLERPYYTVSRGFDKERFETSWDSLKRNFQAYCNRDGKLQL